MKYYIDLGSSTIKTYACEEEEIAPKLIEEKSILLKNFFSEETGISQKNYKACARISREISFK